MRGQIAGGAAIGRHHDFFDQLAGTVLDLLANIHHLLALKHGVRLKGLKFQRTLCTPTLAQALRQRILRAQLGIHSRHPGGLRWQCAAAIDPGTHGVVGQLGLVAHQGAVNGGTGEHCIRIKHHLGHQRQAVFIEIKGRQVGGQALGQHGENARRGVDRGGVVAGVVVHRCAFFDQGIHISNRH